MGRMLVGAGLLLVVLGALIWAAERFTGRTGALLPGDIHVQRGNWHFYFPIATSLALSALLTFLFWLFGRPRP